MNYLDIFNDAKIWIKYVHFLSRKYYKNDFLEIGAGIGSFTDGYKKDIKNIFLTEIDERNVNILKTKYQDDPNIKVFNKKVVEIDKKFNTIAHYNVLEHIKDDVKEIYDCLDNINKNGYLVILVPAHNELYSKLDKEVGHYKRYDKSFFQKLDLKGNSIVELKYVDCLGYLLYYLNKMFFKNETYPSKLKIFIWDKIITPFTIVFDFLTAYKLGKNILCVIKKNN
tara:strand:+ start:2198 stop:2872 length:675 start_codon:yes stop_codon:yes gene_type:complete